MNILPLLLLLPSPKLRKDQRQNGENKKKNNEDLMIAIAARFTKFLIYSFLGCIFFFVVPS